MSFPTTSPKAERDVSPRLVTCTWVLGEAREKTMAIRSNILANASARDKIRPGSASAQQEFPGPSTSSLGIPGPSRQVSTYDLFLQRVLGNDTTFGLPYWDWAADGELSPAKQKRSPLWSKNCMGGSGSPVKTGPFAFRPSDPNTWRVRLAANANGDLVQTNRGLRRELGVAVDGLPNPNRLPRRAHVATALGEAQYKAAPLAALRDAWPATTGSSGSSVAVERDQRGDSTMNRESTIVSP